MRASVNRRHILLSGLFLWLFAVVGTTLVALTEFVSPVLAARRKCPADDLLSSMITAAPASSKGAKMTREWLDEIEEQVALHVAEGPRTYSMRP